MKKIIRRPILLTTICIILLIIGVAIFFASRPKPTTYESATAGYRDLKQIVSVTGKIEPKDIATLGFETSGRIDKKYVEVGDHVEQWQLLLALSNDDLVAQRDEAQANVALEEAKRDEAYAGTRVEALDVQKAKVESARQSLSDAENTMRSVIEDSYAKSDDAVRNKMDVFFEDPQTQNPHILFFINGDQERINVEWQRVLVEHALVSWKSSLDALSVSSNLNQNVSDTEQNLNLVKSFLDMAAFSLNKSTPTLTVSQDMLDVWRSSVVTARTNIGIAISNFTTADAGWTEAKSNLAVAEQELALQAAGSTSYDLRAAEASVDQADASLRAIESKLAKTFLRAPISGVVTQQDGKVGEIAAQYVPLVTVVSDKDFKMTAFVPEADISGVKNRDVASVTLDAYGEDKPLTATVLQIDPGATVLEGVPTYKVTLTIGKTNLLLRPDMTANIDIVVAEQSHVLAIPQRAIITQDSKKFVRVMRGGIATDQEVSVGLRDSEGFVEITIGLHEGDEVVVSSGQ